MDNRRKHKLRVAVMVLLIVLGLALAGEASLLDFEVPIPPAGRLVKTKTYNIADKELLCSVIYSPQSIEDIRAYYKGIMPQKGFRQTEDQYGKLLKQRTLSFRKDDLIVSVAIWDKGAGVTGISIVKYLQPPGAPDMKESFEKELKDKLVLKKMPSPTQDTPGEDVESIPRPPSGVRWWSLRLKDNRQLIYATPLGPRETKDFYRREMARKGWQIQEEKTFAQQPSETEQLVVKRKIKNLQGTTFNIFGSKISGKDLLSNSCMLEFESMYGKARIIIYPNFKDISSGSMVDIQYIHR